MGHRTSLIQGATPPLPGSEAASRPAFAQLRAGSRPHFDVYRTEQVHLTSMLSGGGDWHWRLTGKSGEILADCGGYRSQRDCLAAVEALRVEAGTATVPGRSDTLRSSAIELPGEWP